MTVIALHKPKPCDDIVGGLRKLADDIEAGEVDWPVSTCVVLLGHTTTEGNADADGVATSSANWRVHGYGPRTDTFTVRGLMASAMTDWEPGAG